MRRTAANQPGTLEEMDVDDVTSEGQAQSGIDSDDVQSIEGEQPEQMVRSGTHALSQQHDFIGLG